MVMHSHPGQPGFEPTPYEQELSRALRSAIGLLALLAAGIGAAATWPTLRPTAACECASHPLPTTPTSTPESAS